MDLSWRTLKRLLPHASAALATTLAARVARRLRLSRHMLGMAAAQGLATSACTAGICNV